MLDCPECGKAWPENGKDFLIYAVHLMRHGHKAEKIATMAYQNEGGFNKEKYRDFAAGPKWSGCYDGGWKGEICEAAFSHPAKFSRALIRRIYEHALQQGWLRPGDVVLDPFGGVSLGGLDAMWNGLNWVGIELEPKFVALGEQNIALWQRKYGSKEGWGSARIIQGDSRKLYSIIERQTGQEISSLNSDVNCCIGSPPFSQAQSGGGINREKIVKQKVGRIHALGNDGYNADMQGNTPGQLASLPEGRFEAVISSPPYEHPEGHPSLGSVNKDTWGSDGRDIVGRRGLTAHYGENQPDNFWSAAREIVAQCHAILKPGGHAIWVTKRFVRGGKIVEFSDQWRALCESVGFRLVCRHRAMLVANHGEQETIFGRTERLTTERKSFFRRLAEKKGSPRIDYEDVLCLERVKDTPLLSTSQGGTHDE